jgi:hypothetical protein
MVADAWPGPEPLTLADDEPDAEPPRRWIGVVLAALVALAASVGLAWWIAAPNPAAHVSAPPPPAAPAPPRPAPPPLRYAAADPDPNQVRRALADVQRAYSTGGADALVEASAACAEALPVDPRQLDYCLAFDVYASAIVPPGSGPQAEWFAGGGERDLALARTALPGSADAANRIAQIGALTRAVVPKAGPKPAAVRAKQARRAAPVRPKAIRAAHATKPKPTRPNYAKASRPWYPPGPSTLDGQYARQAAAEAELDRMISQGLIDPPH